MNIQEIITYSIGIVALAIIIRWLLRSLNPPANKGCSSCNGCSKRGGGC